MNQPEKVRQLVAAGVADLVKRLRGHLSSFHADEYEALERVAAPDFAERVTDDLMEKFGCP